MPLTLIAEVLNDTLSKSARRGPVSLSTVDRARRRGLEWLRKWLESQRV